MHIRGEMTSGKWTLSGFVRSRLESLRWFEVDFWPLSVHFRRGPPTIFRKHMPSGMGTESLGVIGCIFAENGPLEGGIESSFWGTGWGAKGDFRRIFGPDPFIFEGGPSPFSESTCPQVWAQKVWEWSDVYSRRMGPEKVALNQVSGVPAGVLRVISCVILTYTRTFSNREPIPFSKAHALSYTHSKVGNDQMHIRGEMTSGKWTLIGFVRSRPESLRWFEVDFWPLSVHFRRGPPTIFRKHMPSGMGTESLGVIGCIFAENGPLEGGIESSFWGTGWGAKGDFMRYSYLYPYIFESRTHTFFESTCPELYAQQSWEWSDAYSWRNDLWKVNFKRVCEKPAGVLTVIWSGFLAPKRSFSKGPPPFSKSTCPQVWAQKVWEWSDAYSRRMGP